MQIEFIKSQSFMPTSHAVLAFLPQEVAMLGIITKASLKDNEKYLVVQPY